MTIQIANAEDAPDLVILLNQLGYQIEVGEVATRINLYQEKDYRLLVGKVNDVTIGFIALHISNTMHLPGRLGRITSFCVIESLRGTGVGNALLAAAEEYFKENSCYKIEVTSNVKRKFAHTYYLNRGYEETNKHFVKFIQGIT